MNHTVNFLSVRDYFVFVLLTTFTFAGNTPVIVFQTQKQTTMIQKILITKFNYSLPHSEFRNLLATVAGEFAAVPGCQWKIWLIDEEKKEGGAVYLFSSEEALTKFKESPLVQSVLAHPALGNFEFRVTDIVQEATAITRGPVLEAVAG